MLETVSSIDTDLVPEALRPPVAALARVARNLSFTIRRGALGQSLGHTVGENTDGDAQKALDILADELEISRQRLQDWAMAQAILSAWWSYEDEGQEGQEWLKLAESIRIA